MKKQEKWIRTNNRISNISKAVAVLLFSAFVLLIFTTYKNLTQVKYIGFLVLSVPFIAYYLFEKGSLALEGRFEKRKSQASILLYITLSAYLFFNLLAGVFSPYSNYANGEGQSVIIFGHGRYDGLLVLILCLALTLIFSIEGGFGKLHTNFFCGTAFLVVLTATIQMLGINFLGFYPYGNFYNFDKVFVTTIGNVDVLSTYLLIAFSVIAFSYVGYKVSRLMGCIWLFVSSLIIALLLEIKVDSGRAALILLLAIAFPILALSKDYFVKFLQLLSATAFGYAISLAISFSEYKGIRLSFKKDALIAILLTSALVALSLVAHKYLTKEKLKIFFTAIIVAEVIALIAFLVYVRFDRGITNRTLRELKGILNGRLKDHYGTNRVGLWKYTILLALKRLFIGYGTGSYRLAFGEFTKTIAPNFSNNTYDFAHNEYLQILYNCGVFGLLSYIGLVLTPVLKGIKKLYKNPTALILTFSVMGYLIQAVFTFSIVIVSPIFFVLLGMLWHEIKD